MSVKLSVAIVAYNNYDDIKEAIYSLDKYTTIEKKLYIVDNGVAVTPADDVEAFKKLLSGYKDVKYLDMGENLGFGKGHNHIIPQLDSEYHAIVNPDILFCEDAFLSIIEYMDSNKDVGMVIPYITDQEGNKQEVYRKEVTVFDMFIRMFCNGMFKERQADHTLQDQDYTKAFQVPFGQGSFLVIRSELFKKLGGFDEGFFMYMEDADLCKRVNQVSKLMYYPGARVIHKWEKGSHKNKTLFKWHVQSMKYYFKKWGLKLF